MERNEQAIADFRGILENFNAVLDAGGDEIIQGKTTVNTTELLKLHAAAARNDLRPSQYLPAICAAIAEVLRSGRLTDAKLAEMLGFHTVNPCVFTKLNFAIFEFLARARHDEHGLFVDGFRRYRHPKAGYTALLCS